MLSLRCEELRYNGQRRRDVPDLASGTLYIDVGDRAVRRKRHSFHHELWHMVRVALPAPEGSSRVNVAGILVCVNRGVLLPSFMPVADAAAGRFSSARQRV